LKTFQGKGCQDGKGRPEDMGRQEQTKNRTKKKRKRRQLYASGAHLGTLGDRGRSETPKTIKKLPVVEKATIQKKPRATENAHVEVGKLLGGGREMEGKNSLG